MTPPLHKFCLMLVGSKTLPTEVVQAIYKKWRAEQPNEGANLESFLKFLIKSGKVSEKQIARLLTPTDPAVPALPEFDVELIDRSRQLDRRDLLMIAIGAGTTLLIVAVFWLVFKK